MHGETMKLGTFVSKWKELCFWKVPFWYKHHVDGQYEALVEWYWQKKYWKKYTRSSVTFSIINLTRNWSGIEKGPPLRQGRLLTAGAMARPVDANQKWLYISSISDSAAPFWKDPRLCQVCPSSKKEQRVDQCFLTAGPRPGTGP